MRHLQTPSEKPDERCSSICLDLDKGTRLQADESTGEPASSQTIKEAIVLLPNDHLHIKVLVLGNYFNFLEVVGVGVVGTVEWILDMSSSEAGDEELATDG